MHVHCVCALEVLRKVEGILIKDTLKSILYKNPIVSLFKNPNEYNRFKISILFICFEKKCLIPVIICKTVYTLNLSQAMMLYG